MEYGIFALMSRGDLSRPAARILDDGIEQIVAAEALGFQSVWLAEHHFSSYSVIPNPLQLAIKLSERTSRITLGTAVLVPPFYHGLRLAEDVVMADVLTGGRLRVGLGAATSATSSSATGFQLMTRAPCSRRTWRSCGSP